MRAMFYVNVKFSHSFKFESNQSRAIDDVSTGISSEIRNRTQGFLAVFDMMSFVTSFFIFFLLLRLGCSEVPSKLTSKNAVKFSG